MENKQPESSEFSELKEIVEKLKIEIMVREDELMDYKTVLKKNENKLINLCSRTGHDFQREREDGPYGETYYICKICGFTTL